MKKIFSLSLVLFFAAIFVMSCRKDNDPQPTVVGVWQPVSVKATGTFNGQTLSETTVMNDCQKKSRITFKADNSGVNTIWNDDNGTCTQQQDLNFTYSYNSSNKTLAITSGGNTQNGTVSTLNNSQMVYTVQSTYDFNGNNIPATLEITANRVN